MKLNTEVDIPEYVFEINHHQKLLSVGSCFSENIGSKLAEDGISIKINPFGILFNPCSIRNSLSNEFDFSEQHVVKKGNQYVHLDAHSIINGSTPDELITNLKHLHKATSESLNEVQQLIITFGTAWVFKRIETGRIVANCHKQHGNEFEKQLMDVNQELNDWRKLINQMLVNNPSLKIILTVSPVRHSKNGLWQNNVSKGLLHQLVHQLVKEFEAVNYFPAYEIVMDELRDYRFFDRDMLHPSEIAISYIYNKFSSALFSQKTQELSKLQRKIKSAKEHRFMQPSTEEIARHEQYVLNLEKEFKAKLNA